ncbi:MAG: bifunctional demethylmenaquinone methyltransferase/2-methoxy-6-polyprenyl-1,4-benzoquinol methylase UbiE [Cyanobacteria bacterium KgW148]|nr:bifunctional demethylmenaquinone methyltransferase/2-methoxy-6-polyprenyl-1,4-benzoquinol methylase UbiE [Cyanobacteria bacterium KgW148]
MSEIAGLFNRIAPVYDDLNDALSLGLHRVWKKMVLRWAQPRSGELWLDLCCGSGDMAILLARSGARTIGVDFAEAQLGLARLKSCHLGNLTWEWGDVLALRFDNNSIDGVTMTYGLRNLTDIDRGLGEIYRVLKPQGRAVILDFHLPDNFFMQQFQSWYLNNIVVPAAKRFNLAPEYAYLEQSLHKFPRGREQVQKGLGAGFRRVKHFPIGGGMMGILLLEK